ncbi:MAG: helix-turn-helix domain-containing protein [Acutalibacteraceae bacterium]|jgi:transcriptional regulator with XRE-family HTH domain
MNDIKTVVAQNIAQLRRAQGITQLELAEKMNYSDKAISKWERGESLPDVTVLKDLADLFGVTVDYLITDEHEAAPAAEPVNRRRHRNRGLITGMSVMLVWLLATAAFVAADLIPGRTPIHWLSFIYAVPVSMIVWLVFNSLWFSHRRNFLIISLLVWSILGAIYVTFVALGHNPWQIFALGIPGQAIILLWSRVRRKPKE